MNYLKKCFIIIEILALMIQTNIYAVYIDGETEYVWSEKTVQTANIEEEKDFLNLSCESAILIEQNTGTVLYEKDSHTKLRPASVTKIMTILLIMEAISNGQINYDTKITCSENAASMGGSQIWLEVGETLTVDEMLKAICIVSANDCCVAMAEHIAGSESAFIQKMNEKAKQLGMNDTCFKNCHGIDEDNHLTTAYDIALMSKELLNKYPEITKYTTTWMDSLRDGKAELVNTNKLIRTYEGATGLKTGSTSLALYNLSASATRDNLSLIAVVMRAPSPTDRVSNARNLLDYGFNTYEAVTIKGKGEKVGEITFDKANPSKIDILVDEDITIIRKKGEDKKEYKSEVKLDNLALPIKKDDIIGKLLIKDNNEIVKEIVLKSNQDMEKRSFFDLWGNTLKSLFTGDLIS